MSRTGKLYAKLMSGQQDANFTIEEISTLLSKLGFTGRRGKGSHTTFQKNDVFFNVQSGEGRKAKAYQMRQIREELKKQAIRP